MVLIDHSWIPLALMCIIMTWFILLNQDPALFVSYNAQGLLTTKLHFIDLLMPTIHLSGFLSIKHGYPTSEFLCHPVGGSCCLRPMHWDVISGVHVLVTSRTVVPPLHYIRGYSSPTKAHN